MTTPMIRLKLTMRSGTVHHVGIQAKDETDAFYAFRRWFQPGQLPIVFYRNDDQMRVFPYEEFGDDPRALLIDPSQIESIES